MSLAAAEWVGVDGCPAGWLAVGLQPNGEFVFACFASAAALFAACRAASVVAIDIPIGLPTAGVRTTEAAARKLLGARHSSVFNVPARPCLDPGLAYEVASHRSLEASGRKLSKQSFAILPKIAEVDRCLRSDASLAARVWEVHPEVCFALWTGRPAQHSKHSGFGFAERLRLIEAAFPEQAALVREALATSMASDDDILDACAALWSAQRIARGQAQPAGDPAEVDEYGLRMCIFG